VQNRGAALDPLQSPALVYKTRESRVRVEQSDSSGVSNEHKEREVAGGLQSGSSVDVPGGFRVRNGSVRVDNPFSGDRTATEECEFECEPGAPAEPAEPAEPVESHDALCAGSADSADTPVCTERSARRDAGLLGSGESSRAEDAQSTRERESPQSADEEAAARRRRADAAAPAERPSLFGLDSLRRPQNLRACRLLRLLEPGDRLTVFSTIYHQTSASVHFGPVHCSQSHRFHFSFSLNYAILPAALRFTFAFSISYILHSVHFSTVRLMLIFL